MHPFFRGLTQSLTIAVGYIPVGASFGLAAIHADLSPSMALLISVLVYAGASQFILIVLVSGGSSVLGVVSIMLLMNLRHLFYGPAVMSRFDLAHRRWPTFFLAAGLTDEVFATSISKLAQQPPADRESWYVGLQLGSYAAWVLGTALGAYVGHDIIQQSEILSQSLGFVLPALFFALLLEIKQIAPLYVLAGVAVMTLIGLWLLPVYAVIIVGMLTGVLLAGRRG
jgi:4-azaleucine resistance transporter AzlC